MGKLNNRGFGMSTMLIFIGIFVVVLIAVMVLAYNNGVEKDSPVKAVEKEGGMFISPSTEEEEE